MPTVIIKKLGQNESAINYDMLLRMSQKFTTMLLWYYDKATHHKSNQYQKSPKLHENFV